MARVVYGGSSLDEKAQFLSEQFLLTPKKRDKLGNRLPTGVYCT